MLSPTFSGRSVLILLIFIVLGFSQCAVYTVERTHLEAKLRPSSAAVTHKGFGINKLLALYQSPYNNRVDTLLCFNRTGCLTPKRLKLDSKVTVITKTNKAIHFYAKTLFIWNEEFLIGERTKLNLRRSNCFSVKLKDIARIEVRG